nr:tripartite tricarboxylate transporter permease [Aeromonas caviae]
MLDGILQGLGTALLPVNLMMVVLGCFIGTFIGMLPGLGPVTAIALMIPITYGLDPSSGIILMAGVYYGAIFGGSTSSILINAPAAPPPWSPPSTAIPWPARDRRARRWPSPPTPPSPAAPSQPSC